VPNVLWLRRDLRRHDHPAMAAAADGGAVVALYVLDPVLWKGAGGVRRAWLARSLAALDASLGGRLVVRHGDPRVVVPEVAAAAGADAVHVSEDFAPYGVRRDAAVAAALEADGRRLVATGSPYAVSPGRVLKADGTPYRVYTPFYRAWLAHGWRSPAADIDPEWVARSRGPLASQGIPAPPDLGATALGAVGEQAALERWDLFRGGALDRYDERRDRADLDGTSMLSAHLRWGELHPRTLLAELGDSPAHTVFRKELAWREFYADVLHTAPQSAYGWLDERFAAMEYDDGPEADSRFEAWCAGRTGYPFVDAGMRQLLAEGWMHNRVRMVTASFLVKDLHLPWQRGAAWFLRHLRDGDVASNQHGWQWTAGCGTDAAPYFRVFNPVVQGLRFDPDGDYVHRYVPELRHLAGAAAHEPWKHAPADDLLTAAASEAVEGTAYPAPIVDHAAERDEALRRYAALPPR
jgi:deoxyribodipyrimidine photo-lyase